MKPSTKEVKAKARAIYLEFLNHKYVYHTENLAAEREKALKGLQALYSSDLTKTAKQYIANHHFHLSRMEV